VRGVRDLANQYEIKDFVPLLGGMGVGDLLLGKSPEELEEWAYGNLPMRVPEMSNVPIVKTGRKEQLMDTMFLGVDAAGIGKGAGVVGKAAAKKLGPKAAEMAETMLQKQGLMPGVVEAGKTMAPSPTAPTDDIGFFSAVEQAAMNVQRKSGTGQAFLNDITKGENVKADEIKWMGLDDFLKGKKNVTREEVQQFIAANRVEVKEVQLGEEGGAAARSMAASDIEETLRAGDMFDDDAQSALRAWMNSQPGSRMESQNRVLLEEKLIYAGENRTVADFLDAGSAQTDATKFGRYTLPGGQNYREILLTLPDNTDPQKARLAFEQRMQQKYGSFNTMKFTDAEKAEGESTMQAILNNDGVVSKGQVFKSSHWEQPNVLAHIRVNDRVDADGKKMLLVEEVQSDWHQAGRDKGYIGNYAKEDVKPYTPDQAKAQFGLDNADLFWYFNVPGNTLQIPKSRFGTQDEAMNYVMTEKKVNPDGVPDAPMKDTWYQLALKRALKYAADNGYERVGITTGARQAERYNLSSQVNQIVVTPRMDAATGEKTRSVAVDLKSAGILQLGVNKNGIVDNARGGFDNPAQFKGKPLADIIGKEMAQKIMDAERATFEGAGLNVGGEGMKKYYDEVYPKFLEKYGKKWGAKVGETTVQADGAEPIRYVDITPEMRQSVSKGQPLFTAAPIGAGTAATMQNEENE
jgi:hypothetical protein